MFTVLVMHDCQLNSDYYKFHSFTFSLHPSPPCMQDNEAEDGGVSVACDINKALIEQQLQTQIYQMSREEAKA